MKRPFRRRLEPSTFQHCLAGHVDGADQRNRRQPKTALGKLGHLLIGLVLGVVAAATVLGWVMQ